MIDTVKKDCGNCRYWSQMVAQSIGCGPIEALCLSPDSSWHSKYVRGTFLCVHWASDHHGKVDDPPNYGEQSRAAYEAEEQKS
jgi:hypothetical protein